MPLPPPLPVVLVSGFLGAGKTTLMRRLILDAHQRGLRACVVVNEFGAADVDGHILAQANAELLASVTGGCACCAGQDDFHDTLLEVASRGEEQRPDVMLVETSGLADPLILLDVMTAPELLAAYRTAALLCVADAGRPEEYAAGAPLGPLLTNQLRLADWVVLNKADLASPATLDALTTRLQTVAPEAAVVPARECDMDFGPVWQMLQAKPQDLRSKIQDPAEKSKPQDHSNSHTLFFPLPHPVERASLEAALASLPPEVWRAKGFVRLRGEAGLHLVQYTGGGKSVGRFRLAPFYFPTGAQEPPCGVVFIGAHLDSGALSEQFKEAGGFLPML